MGIQDSLNAAKAKLEETMRDRRFRRANLNREEKIALQTAQAMCRGKLEVCQRDFNRIIREQSRYIQEGRAIGADTMIQEQMLEDAAIGYMLVRDAIYSLRTINNHNSLSHAYSMMDLATRHMSGKKSGLPLKSIRDRNIYGYVTSDAAYKEKSELLNGFFDELVNCGDIESCLSSARHPNDRDTDLRNNYTNDYRQSDSASYGGDSSSAMDRIRSKYPQASEEPTITLSSNPRAEGNDYGDDD